MKHYYSESLSRLVEIIEKSREAILNNHNLFDEAIGDLIFLGDQRYRAYSSIVETNEYRIIKEIETIAISLLSENKNTKLRFYTIDEKFKKHFRFKSRELQIILNENNKQVGVIFCNIADVLEKVQHFENGDYSVDKLKIVVLSVPNEFAYETLFDDINKMYQQKGIDVERVPILSFWKEHFGDNECKELIAFLNQVTEKVKEIIGFNTVVTPTDKAISKFKVTCCNTLVNKVSFQNMPQALENEYETLKYNYIERQLWRAMIGNCNFAISFITSEWFYNMYQLTENIDLTTVVSGYLKSVEQLLFSIIQLSAGTGITIKGRDRKIIELTEDNNDIVDTTLGSLENVIKHNGQILEISNYAKNCLLGIIDDWRDKQRNGYFHKHNLHSLNKVDEIREEAFKLYFLILGSCSIKDVQFNELGIEI